MNAERLLEVYQQISEAPDAIARLRDLIRDLAVSGKLTEARSNDGSAESLLQAAMQAKIVLRDERGISRTEHPELSSSRAEAASPKHWAWSYLHDFALVLGGKRIPKGMTFSQTPTNNVYIRVTDMKEGSISSEHLKYISDDVKRHIKKYTISKDDLYITIAGTIGSVGSVPEFFDGHNLTENAAKIVFTEIYPRFLLLALQSNDVQSQFSEKTKQMAQPKLALKRVLGARLPVPLSPNSSGSSPRSMSSWRSVIGWRRPARRGRRCATSLPLPTSPA